MLRAAESIPDGTVLQTDVAIIGAGAAGITMAHELAGSRVSILLIESGGPDREESVQTLSRGEIVGTPYWPLEANRYRGIGGTTNLWSGWCRPLDDLDLAARPWVAHSGWPITRAVLDPYYRRAHQICELGPFDYALETWERALRGRRLPLDEKSLTTKMFQLSPPTRFGITYLPILQRAENVTLVHGATVTEIESTPEGKVVSGVTAGTFGGYRFRVEARVFVLAAGGLENARLLLSSNRNRPAGLGNDHDQVGRYFMEHLHFTFGLAHLRLSRRRVERLYKPEGRRAVGRVFLSDHLQQERGVLHGNMMLVPGIGHRGNRWQQTIRQARERLRPGAVVRVAHTLEQQPDRESRVTLGSERDDFGLRRIRLDWRVGAAEHRTFRANWHTFSRAVESAGLGKTMVSPGEDESSWPPPELQGKRGHHMGTTRMSANPKEGVVDTNCRVHGISNLYVAGSSVFPTSGAGTPTLTIVAMAVRLADHLRPAE